MNSQTKLAIALFAGVGILVAAVWGFFEVRGRKRAAKVKVFEPFLAEFTRPIETKEKPGGARRSGKILVLDPSRKQVEEDVHFELPEGLRPERPEEVGTVVWLEYGTRRVGTYTDGMSADAETCRMTVIDRASWTVSGWEEFQGGGIPSRKKKGEAVNAKVPAYLIAQQLVALPER